MAWLGDRERSLLGRVGPVVLRRLDDMRSDWEATQATDSARNTHVDLPGITAVAVQQGADAAAEQLRVAALALVDEGVALDDVVAAVLSWEETILRYLARYAVEDAFAGAAAFNRLLHGLVLLVSEGYHDLLRAERDQTQQQMQDADRLKMELVSMISHDLKTPLTTIEGCVRSLLEVPDMEAGQRRRFGEMILHSAERLSGLISQIVEVGRIEARALDLVVEPLDVVAVTAGLTKTTPAWAAVRLEVGPGTPRALGDREAFERVLTNLIDNAVRHGPEGEPVVVWIGCEREAVLVRVCDRGPGIPQDRVDGLFSKFYQVDSSHTGKRGGSGLGLAIVKGLAESMGGTAGYRRRDEGGAEFWVRLPAAPAGPDPGAGGVASDEG